jgi:hypothetical protein
MIILFHGELVKIADKTLRHKDYEGFSINVKGPEDTKDNIIPYKGGLFLNVPKANGDPFPMKLNIRRPNASEAAFIADLLLAVISNKTFKFRGSKLSDNPGLFARFKEDHPAEFAVLGKDAKVGEVARLFVHMTAETAGKETHLYLKGNHIYYGTNNKWMVDAKNADLNRDALIEFIENNKRRQLNLKDWNNTKTGKKYQDYMLANVISTDAVVGKDSQLFHDKKTLGRAGTPFSYDVRVAIPNDKGEITSDPTPKPDAKALKSIKTRETQSRNKGTFEEGDKTWKGIYFPKSGKREVIKGKSEAAVKKIIKDKYNKEKLALTAPKTDPIIRKSDEEKVSLRNEMAQYEQELGNDVIDATPEEAKDIEKNQKDKIKKDNIEDPNIDEDDIQGEFFC